MPYYKSYLYIKYSWGAKLVNYNNYIVPYNSINKEKLLQTFATGCKVDFVAPHMADIFTVSTYNSNNAN